MAVGEWDERQLCSDGACVGVIGPDGTCKVCGRAALNWGDERKRGLIEPPDDADDADDADDDPAGDDEAHDEDELAADRDENGDEYEDEDEDDIEDDDDDDDERAEEAPVSAGLEAAPPIGWSSRQLCPDGRCIGVIGADGRCKVCGRPASGGLAEPTLGDAATALMPTPAPRPRPEGANGDPAAQTAIVTATTAAAPDLPCADSTCAGVIGRDGHCSQCGKLVAR